MVAANSRNGDGDRDRGESEERGNGGGGGVNIPVSRDGPATLGERRVEYGVLDGGEERKDNNVGEEADRNGDGPTKAILFAPS